jgi:hypothetical protein
LELASGEMTRSDTDKCGLVLSWANSDYSGYYSIPGPGGIWLDWGVHPGTSLQNSIVGSYVFAYATTLLDTAYGGSGATLCMQFYDDALGWCGVSGQGMMSDATFCFSGLAGSPDGVTAWGWIYTVTLTGGWEFTLDGGTFGYGMSFFDSNTGPLLMFAGDANFGNGIDSNGQEDAFDWYVPDVANGTCGTYWFGGYPYNFSSWWLELYVGDGVPTAGCVWYCGTGANVATDGYVILAPAALGGTMVGSVTGCATGNVGAFMVAFFTPLTLPTGWGEILVNIADPAGELMGMPSGFGNPAIISIGVPTNMFFCGTVFYTQAASFGGSICLHCAYTCTIGF